MPKRKTYRTVKEYPVIEGYRVRVIKGSRGLRLDIREHIETEAFSGYSRNGVSLHGSDSIQTLVEALLDALKLFH